MQLVHEMVVEACDKKWFGIILGGDKFQIQSASFPSFVSKSILAAHLCTISI